MQLCWVHPPPTRRPSFQRVSPDGLGGTVPPLSLLRRLRAPQWECRGSRGINKKVTRTEVSPRARQPCSGQVPQTNPIGPGAVVLALPLPGRYLSKKTCIDPVGWAQSPGGLSTPCTKEQTKPHWGQSAECPPNPTKGGRGLWHLPRSSEHSAPNPGEPSGPKGSVT